MAGTVLLVRHGETEWNRARRYQGWLDSPLTPEGIAQAEAIGRRLCRLPEAEEAEIVASPIGRARRTAEIIAECLATAAIAGRSASTSGCAKSRSAPGTGSTSARSGAAPRHLFAGEEGRWECYFRSPDGETYDDFAGRIAGFLADLGALRSSPSLTASSPASCAASMPDCRAPRRCASRCRRTAFSCCKTARLQKLQHRLPRNRKCIDFNGVSFCYKDALSHVLSAEGVKGNRTLIVSLECGAG